MAGAIFDRTGSYLWAIELFIVMLVLAAVLPLLCVPFVLSAVEPVGRPAVAAS